MKPRGAAAPMTDAQLILLMALAESVHFNCGPEARKVLRPMIDNVYAEMRLKREVLPANPQSRPTLAHE